jgi:hypothetical protein
MDRNKTSSTVRTAHQAIITTSNTIYIHAPESRTINTTSAEEDITALQPMSLFPIVPTSTTQRTYNTNTMLATSPHHNQTSTQYHISTAITQLHMPHHIPQPHIDLQALRQHLCSAISHLFQPISCQQCTCSAYQTSHIFVDDEFVLVEEEVEEDGGPLCREATIESWKVKGRRGSGGSEVMLRDRRRRLSVHCFGS